MAAVMDALGVALCYALAAGVILGYVAFVVEARREMRNTQNGRFTFTSCDVKEEKNENQ